MRDTRPMNPERTMQPKFSIRWAAGALLLLAAIGLFDRWLNGIPDRRELGWRSARVTFTPVEIDGGFGPFRLAGAWQLTSEDPRFGGISALAVDRGRLVALTDSGALVRFRPGDTTARIGELPDGPGSGGFKRNRDSEALVRDPGGRGWWVAFENRNQLWLYDADFRRALQAIKLGKRGWRANRGVEGISAQGRNLLLFPEPGDSIFRVAGTRGRSFELAGNRGLISDVAALGPGQFLAIERRPTPLGFRNSLVRVEAKGSGYRLGGRTALPLGPLDNLEAIAVEPLPGAKRRLWLMTDDNFQRSLRTLLIALDLPAGEAAPNP